MNESLVKEKDPLAGDIHLMPLVPVASPAPVALSGGFDYVTVDAARRRVYAAHGGNQALAIVDADSGAVLGQVRVGPMRGVAVDRSTGHVFTANGDNRTVSEVDPTTMKIVRTSEALPGDLDALAFDPATGKLFVDEDDGTRVFVLDAKTLALTATIALPGEKPEYLAVDSPSHVLYQNIDHLNAFVTIDTRTNAVTRTVPTPELQHNHPLQYDAGLREIVVGGTNGMLSAYGPGFKLLGSVAVPPMDQCDLDPASHLIACAGRGKMTLARLRPGAAPEIVAQADVAPGVHTLAIDARTRAIFAVWAAKDGDFVQRFNLSP